MKILENVLHIGLSKPITLFHMTDIHLSATLPEDTPYAIQQQGERRVFLRPDNPRTIEEDFAELLEIGRKCDCVVMTGDVIDAPSKGNLKLLKESLKGLDNWIYAVGNHDYVYPCDILPNGTLDMVHREELQQAVGCSLDVYEKQVGELLLISFDNGYYQVTQEQADAILKALDRGMPTILCCHVPLYAPETALHAEHVWREPIVMGRPDEVLPGTEKWGGQKIKPASVTDEFVKALRGYQNLAAILTGHVHFNYVEAFSEHTTQFVTATALYAPPAMMNGFEVPHEEGYGRLITIY